MKTNLQIYIEQESEASGNSLDEQLCDHMFCDNCPHNKNRHYPYACCYGLFNDLFSTDQDSGSILGTDSMVDHQLSPDKNIRELSLCPDDNRGA